MMLLVIFDIFNIVVLLCCLHHALLGRSDTSALKTLGVGLIGLGALIELIKSAASPHLVDPYETILIMGVATYGFSMYAKEMRRNKNADRNLGRH